MSGLLAPNDVTFTSEDGQIENLHEAKLHNNLRRDAEDVLAVFNLSAARANGMKGKHFYGVKARARTMAII